MPAKPRGSTTSRSTSAAPVPDSARHQADQADTAEEQTHTIRLPFLTVSVARPAGRPVTTPSQAGPRSTPTTGLPVAPSGNGPRLLFYTGVAALGVAGVVEWPVAAAIAAGTYIASRARTAPPRSPSPGPGPASAPV